MIFTFETIIIGRVLFGISTGLFSTTIPRYVEETLPTHLFDGLTPFVFTFSYAVATLSAYSLGEIMPEDDKR